MHITTKMLAAAALLVVSAAQAQDLRTAALPKEAIYAFASTAGDTSTPIGWAGFCREYPGECASSSLRAADVDLTPLMWRTIVAINARVNGNVAPVTDEEHWGLTERWSYPDDGRGDCEDYALLKRRLLMEAGVPRQALLMTVVRDSRGEGHAVLTVVTDKGDLVLDNKRTRILAWNRTGYGFIKRQSQENPNHWVAIGESSAAQATASR